MDRNVWYLFDSFEEKPSENLDDFLFSLENVDSNDLSLPLADNYGTDDVPLRQKNGLLDENFAEFMDWNRTKQEWDDLFDSSGQGKMIGDDFEDYDRPKFRIICTRDVFSLAAAPAEPPEPRAGPSKAPPALLQTSSASGSMDVTGELQQLIKTEVEPLEDTNLDLPSPQSSASKHVEIEVPINRRVPLGGKAKDRDLEIGNMGRNKCTKYKKKDFFKSIAVLKPVKAKKETGKRVEPPRRHKSDTSTAVGVEPEIGLSKDTPGPSAVAVTNLFSAGVSPSGLSAKILKMPRLRTQPLFRQKVPEEQKDAEYYANRKKNTEAARVWREKRRTIDVERVELLNEQLAENARLKGEMMRLTKLIADIRKKLHRYENQ